MDAGDESDKVSPSSSIVEKPVTVEGETNDEKNTYYDFQSFLTLMRKPEAEPIVKYTKSFIRNFISQRSAWSTTEQEKLINDFKIFIYDKLSSNNAFQGLNAAETRNAKEGLEKLVMGKLYTRCFSPCLLEDRNSMDPSHKEDIAQDKRLREKILEFRFLSPEHLDVFPELINPRLDSFIQLSAKELAKINNYKSPRDKMVCILNCCKVLFGILKHNKRLNGGADHFVPLLIFTLLKSHVKFLVSNVRYIERFRFPPFLMGESAYYLSTLQGAINFVSDMDKDSINIIEDDAEFEKKYRQNQIDIRPLLVEEANDLKKGPTQSIGQRSSSPSPSEFILKPLDDAANTVMSKFSDFWNSSVSPSAISPEPEERPHADHHEIDEHTATVLAQQMEQKEQENTLKTLELMFPDLDPDLIQDVCVASRYRVGVCVDALLEMTE